MVGLISIIIISEWRDGKTSHCVYLSSGELYSMTGETPECRDLSEFY